MKYLLTLLALLSLLSSCGKYATNEDLLQLDKRVTETEEAILDLQLSIDANLGALTMLNNHFFALGTEVGAKSAALESAIATLQMQTSALLARQAELELQDSVVGIYDPCPEIITTQFTESFFVMSSGKVVAYFEQGNKRFLTVLKTGTTYRTTDSRSCVFTL